MLSHKFECWESVYTIRQGAIDVATDHNLTGELHYGPQLNKIVVLLENYLQTHWYKIVTEESLSKPNRWLRMIAFLEAQLQIIQTHANETESVDLDVVSSEGSSRKDDGINKNITQSVCLSSQ